MKFLDVNENTPENVNFSFSYRGHLISATNILNKPHIVSVCYWEEEAVNGPSSDMLNAVTVEDAINKIDESLETE